MLATGNAIYPSIPVVVLVDGNNGSAAEIVTAGAGTTAATCGQHPFGRGLPGAEPFGSNGGAIEITVGGVLSRTMAATSAEEGEAGTPASPRSGLTQSAGAPPGACRRAERARGKVK